MYSTPAKGSALHDCALLEAVVKSKSKFYRCKRARCELATMKSVKPVPPDEVLPTLEGDYGHMENNMIFGRKPPSKEILGAIGRLESEIHARA